MRTWIIAAGVLLAGFSAPAVSVHEGVFSLAAGGLLDPESDGADAWGMDLRCGYFFNDNYEIGLRGTYADDGDRLDRGLSLFTQVDYDLGNDWVPYVALGLGGAEARLEQPDGHGRLVNAATVTATAGCEYILTESAALDIAVHRTWASDEIFADGHRLEDDDIHFTFGLRFYL